MLEHSTPAASDFIEARELQRSDSTPRHEHDQDEPSRAPCRARRNQQLAGRALRTVEALIRLLLELGARLKLERLRVGPSELDGRTLRHRRCELHESPQPPDGRRRAEPRPELRRQPTNYS